MTPEGAMHPRSVVIEFPSYEDASHVMKVYVSGDLAEWLQDKGMKHSLGAPYHPQTQGKIERWHQTLKTRIMLENYFLPGDLEAQVEVFADHYNHERTHESLNSVTPADVYFGRDKSILQHR